MAQMLTAKQVAEIKGCSYQYVKKILKDLRMLHTIRTIGAMADTVPALSAKKKLNLMVMSMTKLRL